MLRAHPWLLFPVPVSDWLPLSLPKCFLNLLMLFASTTPKTMNSEVHHTFCKIKVLPSTCFKLISYRFHQVLLVLEPQDLVDKIQFTQCLHDFVYLGHMLYQTSPIPNQSQTFFSLLIGQLLCHPVILIVFPAASSTPLSSRCRNQNCISPQDMHQGVTEGQNDAPCFVIISSANSDQNSLAFWLTMHTELVISEN